MLRQSTLRQLLEVFRIFWASYGKELSLRRSYQEAVRRVAKDLGVTYQTIGDGCRRRLKLRDIGELYALLEKWTQGDAGGITALLKRNTDSNDHAEIENFFRNPLRTSVHPHTNVNAHQEEIKSEVFSIRFPEKEARMLRAIAEIEGISVSEMLAPLISNSLRQKIKDFAQGIINNEEMI